MLLVRETTVNTPWNMHDTYTHTENRTTGKETEHERERESGEREKKRERVCTRERDGETKSGRERKRERERKRKIERASCAILRTELSPCTDCSAPLARLPSIRSIVESTTRERSH